MNTVQHHSFKEGKTFLVKKLKQFSLTVFLLLFASTSVWATHFRYGNVQWQNTDGNTVVFKIQQAWRWSYFGNPVIGTVVDIVAGDGDVPFDFGDGVSQNIQITVTSINAAEDWFFGEITMTHTYSSPGNYTASFLGCCRISTLQNNADEYFHVQTLVAAGNGQKSTVSTVSPIIDLQVDKPAASFAIPAIDPDGGTLTFRLANADEAAGAGNIYLQPDGLSINSNTGVVTFSTVGKTVGDLYTAQIIINNGKTEIGVDFLIRIVEAQTGTPPYFVYPPTPADNSTLTVNAGSHLTFDVKAQDDDNGAAVTLTGVGLPPGATTDPELPATGLPVTTKFDWTPGIADAGTYILTFKATDNDGSSVLTSVNIVVNAVCDKNFSSSIAVSPSPTVPNQASNTIFLGYGPQSVTLTASSSGGNGGNIYDWGSGTGVSIVVSPTSTTTYTVTVTDAFKCSTTSSVTIYVEDVRCGRYGNKILVCYDGCQLCKPFDKVAGLLKHKKAKLGTCTVNSLIAASSGDAQTEVVKEITVKQINLYPNPARSYVVLEMQQENTNSNANINIVDITGRTMMNIRSSNQQRQTINVGGLGSGVYLMQIINSSGKIIGSTKFIISK